MNYIDSILYINLEHRTDRNEHILNQIHKFCKDDSKIHRIDAIKKDNGALGCGLSHIKALEYAMSHTEWNNVLILEDDFTFKEDFSENLELFLEKLNNNYDVALLSFNHNFLKCSDTNFSFIKKLIYSQTASSYIIKKEYLQKLHNNMKDAIDSMLKFGRHHENCIDVHWTKLMETDNWYCIYPSIGYQYQSYSDIEKYVVNYGC